MPGPFFVVPCDQQEENPVYQGERGGEAMEDREILELFRQRDQGAIPALEERYGQRLRARAAPWGISWPGGCWGARRTLRSASATRTWLPGTLSRRRSQYTSSRTWQRSAATEPSVR